MIFPIAYRENGISTDNKNNEVTIVLSVGNIFPRLFFWHSARFFSLIVCPGSCILRQATNNCPGLVRLGKGDQ